MKKMNRIGGINLLVLVAYSVIALASVHHDSTSAMGLMAFAVGLHFIVCLLVAIGLWAKSREEGRAWLLSAFLVLLIGFSACWGILGLT